MKLYVTTILHRIIWCTRVVALKELLISIWRVRVNVYGISPMPCIHPFHSQIPHQRWTERVLFHTLARHMDLFENTGLPYSWLRTGRVSRQI